VVPGWGVCVGARAVGCGGWLGEHADPPRQPACWVDASLPLSATFQCCPARPSRRLTLCASG
jgi:hypothetical protein